MSINPETGYYETCDLLGAHDPWKIFYFGVVGARSIGKSVSAQALIIDTALFKKHNSVWIRGEPKATAEIIKNFPDDVLKNHYYANFEKKGNIINVNGKPRFAFYSLSQAHNIKGSGLPHENIRYIIVDEFNRLPTQAKRFDIADALLSIIQSVARPDVRLKKKNAGQDVIPLSVIFLGNELDDGSSELLERFEFIPESGKTGIYNLPRKRLRLEYVEDTPEWKALREDSPLSVLRKKTDKELGQADKEMLKLTKVRHLNIRSLSKPRHLYRVWMESSWVIDVFIYQDEDGKGGLFITDQYTSEQIYRFNVNYRAYVSKPKFLKAKRRYNKEIVDGLKLYMSIDGIAFSSAMVGRRFINALYTV